MFTTIGAALAGSAPPAPDRQPVRRHSRLVGRCEGVFWRRTDRQEVRRVLLAARRYELAGRPAGRRNGPLGHVGLEVLELLGNLVSFRTGRLEPSLDTLTRLLRRSRAAVVRALRALRADPELGATPIVMVTALAGVGAMTSANATAAETAARLEGRRRFIVGGYLFSRCKRDRRGLGHAHRRRI